MFILYYLPTLFGYSKQTDFPAVVICLIFLRLLVFATPPPPPKTASGTAQAVAHLL